MAQAGDGLRLIDAATQPASRGLLALNAASRELQVGMASVSARVGPFAGVLSAIGPAGTAAAVGLGAFLIGGTKIVQAASEAEQANIRLQAAIRATGNASGLTVKELNALADEVASVTFFDDDDVKVGIANLLRFKSIAGDTFRDVIRVSADFAASQNMTVGPAAEQIGRALGNLAEGAGMLARAFPTLKGETLEAAAELSKAGRNTEAVKLVVDALKGSVGGLATEMNVGMVAGAKNAAKAISDLFEELDKRAGKYGLLTGVTRGLERVGEAARAAQALAAGPSTSDLVAGKNREIEAAERGLAGLQGSQLGATSPMRVQAQIDKLQQLRAEAAALTKQLQDETKAEEAARAAAERSAAAQQNEAAAAALRKRTGALRELTAEQQRALQVARLGAQARAESEAADRAEADLKKKVADATAEEIAAARKLAVEAVRASAAVAAGAKSAGEAQKERERAAKALADQEEKLSLEARRRIEEEIKERDESVKAVAEMVKAIDEETRQLSLNDEERAVAVELIKAETAAKRANRDLTDEEREAIERSTRARERQRDVIEQQEEAERAAKKALEDQQRTAERATDDITSYLADRFADAFTDTEFSWKSLWNNMRDTALRALARIASEAVLRPIVAPVVQGFVGGAVGGIGGGAGPTTAPGTGATSAVGQFGQLLSSNNLGALLGTGGNLFGPGLTHSITAFGQRNLGIGTSGVAGTGLGDFAGQAAGLFGAFGLGQGAGALSASLFGRRAGGIGPTIGSALGTAASAITGIPGLNIIGGLIGGLFGPKPSKGPGWGTIVNAEGRAPGSPVTVHHVLTDNNGDAAAGREAGRELAAALNAFTKGVGSTANVGSGGYGLEFYESKGLKVLGAAGTPGAADMEDAVRKIMLDALRRGTGDGAFLRGGDPRQLAVAKRSLEAGKEVSEVFADLDFAKVFDDQLKAWNRFKTAVGDTLERAARQPIEDITKSFGEFRDRTKELGLPLNEAIAAQREYALVLAGIKEAAPDLSDTERAWRTMTEQAGAIVKLFESLGYTPAEAQRMASQGLDRNRSDLVAGYNDQLRRRILERENPLALALEDWRKGLDQARKDAALIGADRVALERAFELDRLEIIKRFSTEAGAVLDNLGERARDLALDAVSGLRDFQRELTIGAQSGLTPEQRLAASRAEFQLVSAAAKAGDFQSIQEFRQVATSYLDQSRARFGSTGGADSAFREVQRALRDVAALPAATFESAATRMLAGQQDQTRTLVQELQLLRREVEAMRREQRIAAEAPRR